MMINIDIKPASVHDLDLVLPFVAEFHQAEGLTLSDSQRETSVKTLLTNQELGGIWLIDYQNQPVGYIAICFGYSIEFTGRDAFIDEFYIRPAYRGLGLGKQTLERIKAYVKDLGIRALHLEVLKSNLNAYRIYTNSGFTARDHANSRMKCNRV
jgi:GNAT superfamily N-acetyltransferase